MKMTRKKKTNSEQKKAVLNRLLFLLQSLSAQQNLYLLPLNTLKTIKLAQNNPLIILTRRNIPQLAPVSSCMRKPLNRRLGIASPAGISRDLHRFHPACGSLSTAA